MLILKTLKFILFILCLTLLVIFLLGLYIFIRNIYIRHYYKKLFSSPSSLVFSIKSSIKSSIYSLENWMDNVNPTTPINKLVIPGTHDSLTFEWEKSFSLAQQISSIWAKTQYLTIGQQLLAGVRYFDVRIGICTSMFCNGDKTVVAFHSDYSSNVKYEDVIHELIEFSKTHPSELIIWKVRISNNDESVRSITTQMHQMLNVIQPTSSYFDQTIGELRNQRPDKTSAGIIFTSDNYTDDYVWPNSKIFDPYDYNAIQTDQNSFTFHSPRFTMSMNKIYSGKEVDQSSISVMQMIAEYQISDLTTVLESIETISTKINKSITEKKMPPPPKSGYNIIMIDFITPLLCDGIIQMNPSTVFLEKTT